MSQQDFEVFRRGFDRAQEIALRILAEELPPATARAATHRIEQIGAQREEPTDLAR